MTEVKLTKRGQALYEIMKAKKEFDKAKDEPDKITFKDLKADTKE